LVGKFEAAAATVKERLGSEALASEWFQLFSFFHIFYFRQPKSAF
jgi:hypothetical protein